MTRMRHMRTIIEPEPGRPVIRRANMLRVPIDGQIALSVGLEAGTRASAWKWLAHVELRLVVC